MALDVKTVRMEIAAGATSSPVYTIGHNQTLRIAYGGMSEWADSTGNQTIRFRAHLNGDQGSQPYSFVSGGSLVTYTTDYKIADAGGNYVLGSNLLTGVSYMSLEITTAPTQNASIYLLCGRNGPG